MTRSPDALAELAGSPAPGRRGLFVRHAPREAIDSARRVLEARLTPEGVTAARAFGRRLVDLGPVVAWHSPIVRCGETAAAVVEGLTEAGGSGVVAGALHAIGGPYLTDPARAMAEFVRGVEAFVRRWFDGEYERDVILPRVNAARLQLAGLVAAWQAEPDAALAVFVTHDLNILAVREQILGLRHEEAGWIECLDGLRLALAEAVLEVGFGDRVARVPLALLASG